MATKRNQRATDDPLAVEPDPHLTKVPLTKLTYIFMKEYAAKVNLERAVPDFRDGFKPVQRKLLYADFKLPGSRTQSKSAKLIGTVIGNYHPHGDCLRGDTLVPLLNGTTVPIRELANANAGKRWVLAYSEKFGNYVPALAEAWRVGQTTNRMIRVSLSSGKRIEATKNHQFLTKRGWVRSENLAVGDEIIGGVLTNGIYRMLRTEGGAQAVHSIVGGHRDGLLETDEVFHHVDGDRHNNIPGNLQSLSRAAHVGEHVENALVGLANGRLIMFEGATKYRKAIRQKNSELLAEHNRQLAVIKGFKAVALLVGRGIKVTKDSYESLRASGEIYNLTKLSTLEQRGYPLSRILKEREFRIDTTAATGLTQHLKARVVRKPRLITEAMGKGNLLSSIAAVFKVLLPKYPVAALTWDAYVREARRQCGSANWNKCLYVSREKIAAHLKVATVQQLLRKIPAFKLNMVVGISEIELECEEEFYDFTVAGYQNMIVCPPGSKKGDLAFLVAHNSSSYGALDTMITENVPTFTGIGGWSTQVAGPSAMRYTEKVMSSYGRSFFNPMYIAGDVTPFVPNYNRELTEPLVLPALLPNLFFNGASGIGVGSRTSIPAFTPPSVLGVMIDMLKKVKLEPRDFAKRLKFYEQWGGYVDTSKKEVRKQILELMQNTSGSVEWCSTYEEDRAKKSISITRFASGINILGVVDRLKQMPEVVSVALIDAPVTYRINCKQTLNYTEFDAFVAKLDKMITCTHSYSITVTERLPVEESGPDELHLSRDDYQVAFYQMTIPQLFVKWLRWRIQLEASSLAYRIGLSKKRIAFLRLMILVYDNLDFVIATIRTKENPKPILMKRLKITEEQVEQILERKLRQLSKLSYQDLKAKLAAEKQNMAQLEKRAANPRGEVLAFLESAKAKFKQEQTEFKAMIWTLPEIKERDASEIDGSQD